MARAIWRETVIAESNDTVTVEGNIYSPPDSLRAQYLKSSDTHTVCPWKGTASYQHVEVNGERNTDAAWFYPDPRLAATQIRNYVAFWKGVRVEP